MEVILAESAGFCFGVKRAVDKVYEQIASGKKIYTYGPIIHNEFVVQDLEKKGVQVIESEEELEKLTEGTVVIRSHGVPKSICEKIEKQGLECVDAVSYTHLAMTQAQEDAEKAVTTYEGADALAK